jgi:hypothetical protein
VDDPVRMDMPDSVYNLAHVVLDLDFGEHLPAFQQLAQRLTRQMCTLLLQSSSRM